MDETVTVGQMAPDFCLPDQDMNEVCLSGMKGRWIVLYFYPKDNTPGCSLEAASFTGRREDLGKHGAVVIGISRDSPESHRGFIRKKNLGIELLSDADAAVHRKYGVWKPRKIFGREVPGTVRSTFLINPEGVVERVWSGVDVNGHAEDVLETLEKMG